MITGAFQMEKDFAEFTLTDGTKIQLFFSTKSDALPKTGLFLFFSKEVLTSVSSKTVFPKDYDTIVVLQLKDDFENSYLENFLNNFFQEQLLPIPKNMLPLLEEFKKNLSILLEKCHLYFPENKPKLKSAKAKHRFSKELQKIPFQVDDFNSKATVFWEKRDVLKIEKGALLKADVPLTKKGEIGLSAKMGLQLRLQEATKIKENRTIADIYLKSVNEVGLFLYFGQTNSWLILKDADGKSLHDYAVYD